MSLPKPRLKYRRFIRALIRDVIRDNLSLYHWHGKHPSYQLLSDQQVIDLLNFNEYLLNQLQVKW